MQNNNTRQKVVHAGNSTTKLVCIDFGVLTITLEDMSDLLSIRNRQFYFLTRSHGGVVTRALVLCAHAEKKISISFGLFAKSIRIYHLDLPPISNFVNAYKLHSSVFEI